MREGEHKTATMMGTTIEGSPDERMPSGAPRSPIWDAFEPENNQTGSGKVRKDGRCKSCGELAFGAPRQLVRHIQRCKKVTAARRLFLLDKQKEYDEGKSASAEAKRAAAANKGASTTSSRLQFGKAAAGAGAAGTVDVIKQLGSEGLFLVVCVDDRYTMLKKYLLKAVVDVNIKLSAVESPYFLQFCQGLDPDFDLPSRKHLSTTVLDRVYNDYKESINEFIQSSEWISIAMDGWTNVRQDHLVNFMVMGDDHRTELLDIEDTRGVSQVAERVAAMVAKHIDEVGVNKVNAVTSDSAPNYVLAKEILQDMYPTVIFLACQSHLCNLLFHDILKGDRATRKTVRAAGAIVKCFRHSGAALAELRAKCGAPSFQFPQATVTRWNSYHESFRQLLLKRRYLEELAGTYDPVNVNTKSERTSVFKSESVRRDITNKEFWQRLEVMVFILEPYSTAANAQRSRTQSLCGRS